MLHATWHGRFLSKIPPEPLPFIRIFPTVLLSKTHLMTTRFPLTSTLSRVSLFDRDILKGYSFRPWLSGILWAPARWTALIPNESDLSFKHAQTKWAGMFVRIRCLLVDVKTDGAGIVELFYSIIDWACCLSKSSTQCHIFLFICRSSYDQNK